MFYTSVAVHRKMCKEKKKTSVTTVWHRKIIHSFVSLPLFLAHIFLLINHKERGILKVRISVIHNNLLPGGFHGNAQRFSAWDANAFSQRFKVAAASWIFTHTDMCCTKIHAHLCSPRSIHRLFKTSYDRAVFSDLCSKHTCGDTHRPL